MEDIAGSGADVMAARAGTDEAVLSRFGGTAGPTSIEQVVSDGEPGA